MAVLLRNAHAHHELGHEMVLILLMSLGVACMHGSMHDCGVGVAFERRMAINDFISFGC